MAKLIRVWDGTTWQSVGNALPNALTIDGTQILTNKTINLASNTVNATLAQLNSAVSDADVASLAGSETLTNKTINLASNTVSATLAQLNTAVSDADVASLAGTETLTNKTISGSSNTLSNIDLASQVTGTLPVGNGGTGQTTATAATNALLPSQTSNSGKYLTTDGTNTSWGSVDLSGKTDKSILTTTGDIYYASSANTPARIGIGSSGQVLTVASGIPSWATASAPNFRGCSVYNDFNTTCGNDAIVIINMNLESYDTDNFHDNVTNNSRITIPAGLGGYYLITSRLRWDQNGTGPRYTYWYKNGVGQAWVTYDTSTPWGGGGSWPSTPLVTIQYLNAGDYVQTAGKQQSGGDLPCGVWEFTVSRLGG